MADPLFIGLMSGTSMDAVDTALVRIGGQRFETIAYEQFPIDNSLKLAVRNLNSASNIAEVTKYDYILGNLFADSVLKILHQTNTQPAEIAAIGSHGQTILHLPESNQPRTLQIGDPNIIAQKTGITTIADFRRRDMAAGGQGAPLAPAFHNYKFRRQGVDRLILNLGGIANFSLLPGDLNKDTCGFDTGPGNGLMDDWNRLHNGTDMDMDGNWAATGTVSQLLLQALLAEPFFKLPPPKSTGRDHFNIGWLNQVLTSTADTVNIEPASVQATLLELTAQTITDAVLAHAPGTAEIYLCGGGAHNKRMVARLKGLLPHIAVTDTGQLGVDPDAVEAACFAWLASQTLAGSTGNDPAATGAANAVILGGIYPA